ncbi:ROK family protein, partial [Streptomyces sp. NPDC048279]
MRHVIALDVGGTGMKAALVGPDGELLHQDRRATGRERGPDAVVAAIVGFAADLYALGVKMPQYMGRWGQIAPTMTPFSPVVDGEVL